MSVELLEVRHDGTVVGTLVRRGGRIRFRYDDAWRRRPDATPLSLSMPLTAEEHPHRVVDAYLWGLLPDNDAVLARWARDFQVSASHPFGLLAHVGSDLPGAMQIVPPDSPPADPGVVHWLSHADIARLVRTVREDQTAWLSGPGDGRWSLAGAQAKVALVHQEGRWGRPSGRIPTTHILKPAIPGFVDHDLNEHLCLRAATSIGLRAAHSWVETFDGERAVVVERYDRLRRAVGTIGRVHQEDVCQALGVHPSRKYQSDGGPSPVEVIDLVRSAMPPRRSDEATRAFVDALILNWLLGAPDAHAKNHSLLLAGRQVRLAPLYDLASSLTYPDLPPTKVRLAMKIGGYYRLSAVGRRAWERFAEEVRVEREWLLDRIRELGGALPDAMADAAADPAVAALGSRTPRRLADAVARRATHCIADL